MCNPAFIPLVAAAVTAGAQVYTSNQQKNTARDQMRQQSQLAATPPAPKTQEAKAPGQDTLNAAIGTGTNALGTGEFGSNTLLTGAQGVQDPLNLSKNRLFGGVSASGMSNLLGA